ncbi:ABC transporter ATP-binding protein [Paraoerskovia marina]|uniref:ABC transporter ATP-binding protein n=1 Tax=Paraoerskovia marina TaxID=545619 RepID=UPI000694A505|nr:ABC transporter ATP-binding protein [Paraoerskovia marina]
MTTHGTAPTTPLGADRDLVVSVRGLRKEYGATTAVDGLDLDVGRGEIFAMLGPNGAGKTTTTEILAGHRRATTGDVSVLGLDPARASRAWRSRVGVVLQSTNDLAELSIRELVHQFARYYPDPRDPDDVVEMVGLGEQSGSRARSLSGGQRRRLDVALGVVGRPELLFLDEPTTGFDPQARRSFWELLRELRATGTTIWLTTHYLDEADALADRVAVMRAGSIVALDSPAGLRARTHGRAVVRWDGGEATTASPTTLVQDLAARYQGEVPALEVRRPSLEDVYLELIGQTPDAVPESTTAAQA